jgi:hypothetical protein
MAYVTGYQHDIFISYCHHDNAPVPGRDLWVTTFVEALRGLLQGSFGQGVDQLNIFLDEHSFEANRQLPHLLAAVRASAVFLAICSPNYESREWTRKELQAFCENKPDMERLFAIETHPLDAGVTYPEPLQSHHRILFWTRPQLHVGAHPQPLALKSPEWINKVDSLVGDIKRKLKSMRAAAGQAALGAAAPVAVEPAYRRVLLAQTGEALEKPRRRLLTHLKQFGVPVLPEGDYMQGAADFAREFGADLEKSDLFVQLLGESPGPRPRDRPEGYPRFQFDEARRLGKHILQWRDPGLDLEEIEDPAHRELVGGAQVIADGFETFKADVLKAATPPPPPPPPIPPPPGADPDGSIIFVGAEQDDMQIASQIKQTFNLHRLSTILSCRISDAGADDDAARRRRSDLEQAVVDCDALVVIYGPSGRGAGRRVITRYNKLRPRRETPARALAILYVDPAESEPDDGFVGVQPEILHIRSPGAVDAAILRPIIEALRGAGPEI